MLLHDAGCLFDGSIPAAPTESVLLGLCLAIRRGMKNWLSSDDGGRWNVELDVRDLGEPP